ncbi:hypothetical protein E3N88_41291 [Mikania micrantha]|uniref:Uncharacterized protein n=1 Tax=Mikania micrantha TaxID=192012 RepID=A0A5N6LQ56_9ASTR|nr:hypothetical protein E3N88_41291 [Mikania micrantha]
MSSEGSSEDLSSEASVFYLSSEAIGFYLSLPKVLLKTCLRKLGLNFKDTWEYHEILGDIQRKMASFAETLLAAQISLASVIMMTGFLLQYVHAFHNLIGTDQSFPISELHKKGTTEPEAKDGSDDEDDDDDDDDEAGEPEDDAGDEDFSGDEKEEDDDDDDDDDGEANDPAANGNQEGQNDTIDIEWFKSEMKIMLAVVHCAAAN